MAKGIVVTYAGAESSFGLEKLERSKLYGYRRRVAVDSNGEICTRSALTEDGQFLLRTGMTAQGYFDAEGQQVEAKELGAVDERGEPLPLVPSTLGMAQALEGPVEPQELLDLVISSVYSLVAEQVAPTLQAQLAAGRIFRLPFNYRPDYRCETAYIVQNDMGVFALVGVPAPSAWLSPDTPPPADDEGADDAELDFEML
jgi:hypothetical protein